jgi:glutamate-1-semialdehyde 2,1-aminomutase
MDTKKVYQEYLGKIQAEYISKRPKSQALHKEARKYLPGGDTRTVAFFSPFPSFIDRGEGCRLYDVDGHVYIDFGNNQTSMIHGHAHPKIVEAVTAQVKRTSAVSAPVEQQYQLGKIICDRLPSSDKVRFCNSGTEATMGAIRLAREYRKRYKIVKIEGGYHGSHDIAEISVKPPVEKAGPIERPRSVPEDDSIPPKVVSDCIIIPFNQGEVASQIIAENHDELAAVIVEPVLGAAGMVPSDPEFLRALREVTSKYKVPLIFDEVYTLRLSKGGYQGIHNIIPDITALGKIIGGGYPVGGIAGREEFMDLFNPMNPTFLTHSGTFNGNPVTMAAGVAGMTLLTESEIARINKLGEKLRADFNNALEETGIIAQVTGTGSLSQVHFTKAEVIDWRSASTARVDLRSMAQLLLMNRGIFTAGRFMFNISTPMTEKEVSQVGKVLREALRELRPYIEKAAPELIVQ